MRPSLTLCDAQATKWRCRGGRSPFLFCLALLLLAEAGAAEVPAVRGVPFSRSYTLDDIGHVPRGSRMGFDRYGRLAMINETIYTVLNDSTWLDLAAKAGRDHVPIANIVEAPDGRAYYGARGSWGLADKGPDGRLRPVSLVPANAPAWIGLAVFGDIFPTANGIFFASWNGVVYWDFRKRESLQFELPRIAHAFPVGSRIYISAFEKPLRFIDLESGTVKSAAGTALDDSIVETATPLDGTRSLVSLLDGRLMIYDGQTASPWPGEARIKGHVVALQRTVDGKIATGVAGQGLLLFSSEGELLMALTTPPYHTITSLANREPGVLWAETDETISKILYSSPLSVFSQRPWSLVASANDRLFMASDGKLYQANRSDRGRAIRFELCEHQPVGGAWCLAGWGKHMLVGSGTGLFSVEADGSYHPLRSVGNLAQLVMYDEDHCYLIGREAIALAEWRNGNWEEVVPRIPGVPNPAIVHRVGESVWMEMGAAGVARLWTGGGQLRLDLVRNETWTKATWVNIGSVGDLVVLSAREDEPRRFFDQHSGQWRAAPELEQLLNRSPYWIGRVQRDASGVIWGCHNEGLVRFAPKDGDYEMDPTSFDLVNDRYPSLQILPENQIWVSAARTLFHVENSWIGSPARPQKPLLVSLANIPGNREFLGQPGHDASWRFDYAQNNLSFRFYSGSDAWWRAPVYEFRLNENEPWSAADGSLLTTRGLREGAYQLQVRVAGPLKPAAATTKVAFEILPPWHRTLPAYLSFGAGFLALLFGVGRWTSYLERRRNRLLEQVVTERTRQLEATMAQLEAETRKAATLEERDRLANEIHDSVQQGLTGAILQLDTTLKHPTIAEEIVSRLNVVRNMVSYARQEVQHAVWDIESPLLEGTVLADALRNLTTFVDSTGTTVEVVVSGEAWSLGRSANHNLLRVAQEATNNAIRHARATRIQIRLAYSTNTLVLEIVDDGIGFRPDDVHRERVGHLGLRGIRTRVKKLHAQLTILSAPGEGTVVRVVVPRTDAIESKNANDRVHEQDPHPAR